jgi:hypothetical protein
VFNTAMSALAFLSTPSTAWTLGRRWYVTGGGVLMTILGPLGDCILIPSLLDWLTLDMPLRRYVFAPRQKTQLGMDRLWIKQSDLYLAFRVQLASKFVVLCLAFGAAMPMLYLFGCVFFLWGMLIDRFNLLRNQTPPPRTSAKLTLAAHCQVLPLAIVLHAALAPLFYQQLSVDDARSQRTPPPPLAPPPPPHSPGFEQSHPPPPAAPAAFDTHLETAIYLTIALAALVALLVGIFLGCTKPRQARLRVRASEAAGTVRHLLRLPPLPDRTATASDELLRHKGPVPVPTIRPRPRETYMPPQLSKTLLATFAGVHGNVGRSERSQSTKPAHKGAEAGLKRQLSNLSPSPAPSVSPSFTHAPTSKG